MLTVITILLFLGSSLGLVWFFLKNDHGNKKPRGVLLAAAGFGLVAAALAGWAELFLPNPDQLSISLVGLLLISLAVGFIEEIFKSVPLALFIKNKPYFREHADGVIYFAVAGLTFGLIENLLYLLVYSHHYGTSQLIGITRLIVLFFFHAASTGIFGYYFAKYKIRRQSLAKPITALMILALTHGTYDFVLLYSAHVYNTSTSMSDGSVLVILLAVVGGLIISTLLNTFLFLYYGRAKAWDVSMGLAQDPRLPKAHQEHQPHQPSTLGAAAI